MVDNVVQLGTRRHCCVEFAQNLIRTGFAYGASGIERYPNGSWNVVFADEHVVLSDIQHCPFCGAKLEC